jgi:hypothetical protein
MKAHWHEQIQRYVAGDSTREETVALQQALRADAELRALYLDYLNLEAALGAAAEAAAMAGHQTAELRPIAWPQGHSRRWLAAATAACVALAVLTIFRGHRDRPDAQHDFDASISSTQNAIARLSFERTASFPDWMSPTASMLKLPVTHE